MVYTQTDTTYRFVGKTSANTRSVPAWPLQSRSYLIAATHIIAMVASNCVGFACVCCVDALIPDGRNPRALRARALQVDSALQGINRENSRNANLTQIWRARRSTMFGMALNSTMITMSQ